MFDSWFPEGYSTLEQLMWLRNAIAAKKNPKKSKKKEPEREEKHNDQKNTMDF